MTNPKNMEENKMAQTDPSIYLITLYKKVHKHWSGDTISKRLRIGWHKRFFFEWEDGGTVSRRPIIGGICEYLSRGDSKTK